MKKLVHVDGSLRLINRHNYPVCQILSVLYKLDVTQGRELSKQLISVIAIYSPTESIIL